MKILIADDHALFREGLKQILQENFEGAVLGASPSPAEEPDWRYGMEKRDVEHALAAGSMPPADAGALATVLPGMMSFWPTLSRELLVSRLAFSRSSCVVPCLRAIFHRLSPLTTV